MYDDVHRTSGAPGSQAAIPSAPPLAGLPTFSMSSSSARSGESPVSRSLTSNSYPAAAPQDYGHSIAGSLAPVNLASPSRPMMMGGVSPSQSSACGYNQQPHFVYVIGGGGANTGGYSVAGRASGEYVQLHTTFPPTLQQVRQPQPQEHISAASLHPPPPFPPQVLQELLPLQLPPPPVPPIQWQLSPSFLSSGSNHMLFMSPAGVPAPVVVDPLRPTLTAATWAPMGPGTLLAGAVPWVLTAAPASTKHHTNGMQYDPSATYEGIVKRYNPVRGFGFLTATHQILPREGSKTARDLRARTSSSGEDASADGGPVGSDGNTSIASGSAVGETVTEASSQPHSAPTCVDAVKESEVRVPISLGDIFVHQSYVHMSGFRSLPVGGRVRFGVGYLSGQETFQAVNVELLPQVALPSSEPYAAKSPATAPSTRAMALANRVGSRTPLRTASGVEDRVVAEDCTRAPAPPHLQSVATNVGADSTIVELTANVHSRLQSACTDA